MYHAFVSNIIDVLFLCGVVIWIDLFLNKRYSPYVLGVMFGLITIFVIQGHFMVVEGRFFDFRHITMTMAGFIGGPVTAVIAAIISSVYRYNVGGTGSMGGIVSIIVFACFGSILCRCVKSSQNGKKLLFWAIIGIGMACILLFIITFTFPSLTSSRSVAALRTVAAPFLIITPFATTIIFNFYFWTREFFNKASILDTIINFSPINIIIFDASGPILISKTLKMELQSYPYIEDPNLLLDPDKPWPNTTKQQRKEITTENGRYFVTDLSSFQMPNREYACVAIVNDITDRKREQEKIRVANERFSKAFQLGPHMMAIITKSDYRYVDVNCRFLEVRGFAREYVIGKTPIEIGVSESEFKEVFEALEEYGAVQNFECSLVMKYGSKGTGILSAEEIQIDDQECILFVYNDVTEMKRLQTERVEQLTKYLTLEADLSKSNQLIADIITNMQDGFYVLDNEWHFTFANRKVEELFLKTPEELLGKVFWEAIPQAQVTLAELNYQKARNDFVPITFESLSLRQKDTWYQVTVYPSQFGLSVYYRDITELKLAGEKLIKSQEEMASILESMTDGFCAIDRNWQITYINCAGEIALGKSREELLSKKMTELFKVSDAVLRHYHKVISEKKSITIEIL